MKNAEDPKLNINVRLLRRVQRAILKWPDYFNMSSFGQMTFSPLTDKAPNCESAACIGGWAYTLGTGKPQGSKSGGYIKRQARKILGLTSEQAERLFIPDEYFYWLDEVKPKEAIAAIDRLIETKGAGDPWKRTRKTASR